MASRYFRGDAPKVAKVYTLTVAGSPVATDTITIAFKDAASGNTVRSLTYTLVGSDLDVISAALTALINDSAYEEVKEFAATDETGGIVTITQLDQYKGETAFIEVSDTGTVTASITTTTASSGPGDWSLAENWVGGSTPTSSDDLYLDGLPYNVTDMLEAFSQVLSVRIVNCKRIGRELHNGRYREYRPRFLKSIMSKLYINSPESDLLRIDLGTITGSAIEVIVDDLATDGFEEGMEALCLKCAGSVGFNLTVNRGSVGIAAYEGETAKVPSIVQGFRDSPSDSHIRCGIGATLTNVYRTGGSFRFASALTLLEQREQAGEAVYAGNTATLATVTLFAGSLVMMPIGTDCQLTNVTIGKDCTLDLSKCAYPVRCPNPIICYEGANIIDPFDRLAIAVPADGSPDPFISITPAGCSLEDVNIIRKTGKTYNKV